MTNVTHRKWHAHSIWQKFRNVNAIHGKHCLWQMLCMASRVWQKFYSMSNVRMVNAWQPPPVKMKAGREFISKLVLRGMFFGLAVGNNWSFLAFEM